MVNDKHYIEIDVMEQKWDNLIILDGCRYDYFKKVYKKYLKGNLKKAISPSTTTVEFVKKVFSFHFNTIYISANPIINSITPVKNDGIEIFTKGRFYRIIDVWDYGWRKDLGTVPPEEIEKTLWIKKQFPKKRFIIHFNQPHEPYIGKNYKKYITTKSKEKFGHRKRKRKMFIRFLSDRIGAFRVLRFGEILGVKSEYPTSKIFYKEGIVGVQKAYKENLELALKTIKRIIPQLKGKTIIISDHGEYLGEHGHFGHGLKKPKLSPLIEVPYFEVMGVK